MSGLLRRMTHRLYRSLETSVHPLRYLFLEVTQRCNLACRHCGSDCGSDRSRDGLSANEWADVIGRLPGSFPRSAPAVVITGGEPLCLPGLGKVAAALGATGLRWGMVTNGWALDRAAMDRLTGERLQSLTVSLDGLRESHDWLRGREGSFDRAVRAIRLAVEARLQSFDVVTCVHPGNLCELDALHELLTGLGVPAWRLFSIFPKGRAAGCPGLSLGESGIARLLEWITAGRRSSRAMPRVQFCCEGYLPPAVDRRVRDEPYFCRAGIAIGSVLSDGSIGACPNIDRSLVQGNVRDDDLAEVWEARFAAFRDRSWLRTGECADCGEWRRCQGNSLHLWQPGTAGPALCHYRACRGS